MNLNTLKGLLIILVIIDHNDFSRSIFPRFLDAFAFHVVGFMAIPFLRPAIPWSRAFATYVFRLYHPFLVVFTAMTLAVWALTPVAAMDQFVMWLLALYSGNSAILKTVAGMSLLWFLPSFISLVALRAALGNAGFPARAIALAVLSLLHLFVGTVHVSLRNYLPMGLLPAIYVVPLCCMIVLAQQHWLSRLPRTTALLLSAVVLAGVKVLQIRAGLLNEVGFAEVADYTNPIGLLLNDLESVVGVLMLFQLSRFEFPAWLQACGKYSMQIYLFHAFIALGIYKLLLHTTLASYPLAAFAVSVSSCVFLSLTLARTVLAREPVQRLLFPKQPGDVLKSSPQALQRGEA